MKFGLKSILVVAAIGMAIVSAILVAGDTVAHAVYAVDAAVAILGIAHFTTDT